MDAIIAQREIVEDAMPGATADRPLRISAALWQAVAEQVRAGVPEEICGLLGGVGRQVLMVFPAENVAPDRASRYEVDPQALIDALHELEAWGSELVAIYHSHPPGVEAVPSAADVREARYPGVVHVIIMPDADGTIVSARGFLIEPEGEVREVALVIGPDEDGTLP